MSDVVLCINCGKPHEAVGKFCIYCGEDLEEVILEFKDANLPVKLNNSKKTNQRRNHTEKSRSVRQQSLTEKQTTFFCPKCLHENSFDNLFCVSCDEDFSKYNISARVHESTRKKRKLKGVIEKEIDKDQKPYSTWDCLSDLICF